MRRKRILIVCSGLGSTGSVAAVAMRQAQELAREYEVELISESCVASTLFRFHELKPGNWRILRRWSHVPREIAFAWSARQAVRKCVTEGPVKLVICHSHSIAAALRYPGLSRLDTKVALVTHANIFDRPPGTYDPWLTRFYRAVTPIALRTADKVFAVSPRMAELAEAQGAPAGRVHLIPNGHDPTEIGLSAAVGEQRQRVVPGPLQLGYVGRLSVEKGVDTLLDACSALRRSKLAFRLRLIGDGPERERLMQLREALELGSHVEFLGPRPREELGAHYSSFDLLCVPSRSEPFGLVALEAMAAGTPVLASNVGGLAWLITDNQSGLLFPADDPVALARRIQEFVGNPILRARLAQAASARAMEFTWPEVVSKMCSVIDQIE